MNKRKKTPISIEADVLSKSGRRCCVCYALQGDFTEKKGQIAHLDHNPANNEFDNLCFLCWDHHDDYDSRRSQSKGLTPNEVKIYRSDLYKTFAEWKESKKAVANTTFGFYVPLFNFFEITSPVIKKSTQGLEIFEQHTCFRLSDRKDPSSINWDIQFKGELVSSKTARVLQFSVALPFGLTMLAEVCAYDNWSTTGFMNVLRNKLDIWILHGQPLKNDDRDLIMQPTDFLLVYRTSDGENRMILSTHSISESLIQVHARLSENVINALADYL